MYRDPAFSERCDKHKAPLSGSKCVVAAPRKLHLVQLSCSASHTTARKVSQALSSSSYPVCLHELSNSRSQSTDKHNLPAQLAKLHEK